MTDQTITRVTQADIQALEAQDKHVEVEDGEIIASEQGMVLLHVIVIDNVYDLIKPYVKQHNLGRFFSDGARYILKGGPEDVKRAYMPDCSFVRKERIPADFDWTNDFPFAPDFAVEVASPGQDNAKLLGKIAHYLEAGCEEAWLIYPQRKKIQQYRAEAEGPVLYREEGPIDVAALFPGLEITVQAVFAVESA